MSENDVNPAVVVEEAKEALTHAQRVHEAAHKRLKEAEANLINAYIAYYHSMEE